MRMTRIALLLALLVALPALAEVNIYVADHHNKTVIKIKEDGTLLWAFPNNNGHDVQLLKNGNVLIVTGEVQEVTPDKKVVWQLGRPTVENSEAAQRLENGNTMIADNGKHAVIEINAKGEEVWHFDVPNNNKRPQPTMRQVRRLPNGNTLICASTEDEVWEVSPQKEIVWRYKVPFPYLATAPAQRQHAHQQRRRLWQPERLVRDRGRQARQDRLEVRRRGCPGRPATQVALRIRPPRRRHDIYLRGAGRGHSRSLHGQENSARHYQSRHGAPVHAGDRQQLGRLYPALPQRSCSVNPLGNGSVSSSTYSENPVIHACPLIVGTTAL